VLDCTIIYLLLKNNDKWYTQPPKLLCHFYSKYILTKAT